MSVINSYRVQLIVKNRPKLLITANDLCMKGIHIVMKPFIDVNGKPRKEVETDIYCNLIKTSLVLSSYLNQIEHNCSLGDISVVSDCSSTGTYKFSNCFISGLGNIIFDGVDGVTASTELKISGNYIINSKLLNK